MLVYQTQFVTYIYIHIYTYIYVYNYITVPLILKGLTDGHTWKQKQKQILFLTKQCCSTRYKVLYYPHVVGVTQKSSLLPASNSSNNNDTKSNKLSNCISFHLHNFYFPVLIFLCQFSFFAK